MMKAVLFWALVLSLISCDRTDMMKQGECPTCFQTIMKRSNPPLEIWSYLYNEEIVYLVIADCCDQYDIAYNSSCSVICSPGGGFSGQGDGKCPDFYSKAKKGILIWKKE